MRTAYAETPTFSRIAAVETISAAVLKPKLYVQGATGWVPEAAMAVNKVSTCVCSVCPIDFRLVRSVAERPSARKSESWNIANPC